MIFVIVCLKEEEQNKQDWQKLEGLEKLQEFCVLGVGAQVKKAWGS